MMPAASTTEIEPTPVSPAFAELRLGIQSEADAPEPPTRWLCNESCRSDASPAAKVLRMYSARTTARSPARLRASLMVCARHSQRSTARIAPRMTKTPRVSPATPDFRTSERLELEIGE